MSARLSRRADVAEALSFSMHAASLNAPLGATQPQVKMSDARAALMLRRSRSDGPGNILFAAYFSFPAFT